MDIEIRDLANNFGTSIEDLQQLLKTDEAYVDRLISQTQEEAEQVPFIGDLRNVLGLMRSHNTLAKTAARFLGQTPDDPFNLSPIEEETEEEEEDRTTYPNSSSSEDEAVEAQRLRLDPDYVPSTASEGTTATNCQVTSEVEEWQQTETDDIKLCSERHNVRGGEVRLLNYGNVPVKMSTIY
jgi:hypothetical protein